MGQSRRADDGQGDGVPRLAINRRRRTREPACVQTPTLQGGTCREEWQKPPVRRKGGRAGMPKKGKWSPRGTGTTVLTYPGSAPR